MAGYAAGGSGNGCRVQYRDDGKHQQEAPVHLSIANTEQNGRFHSDDELPPSPRSVPATDHATDASYW